MVTKVRRHAYGIGGAGTTQGRRNAQKEVERHGRGGRRIAVEHTEKKKKAHKTERRTRNEVATSMDKKMARLRAMRKKK